MLTRKKVNKRVLCVSLGAAAVALAMIVASPTAVAQGVKAKVKSFERNDADICVELTELAERTRRFPKGLLYAIARVESGRLSATNRSMRPWPWTVTVEGEGRYYESKQQAVRAVEQMQRDNRSNIDVGCMQVNLQYHGRAFRNVSEALDPVNNVAYATEYLVVLYKRYRNWEEAVKHYHSSDPTKHDYYLARVKRAWEKASAPRSKGSLSRIKKREQQKDEAPVLSREEATQLEREALLLADGLRKKLGIIEQKLPASTMRTSKETSSAQDAPRNAQNLNAGFFLDLIDEPL